MKPINQQIEDAEKKGHNHFLIATEYWMILVSKERPHAGSSRLELWPGGSLGWQDGDGTSYYSLTEDETSINVFGKNEQRLLIDSWVE